jgi:hypothetical protein
MPRTRQYLLIYAVTTDPSFWPVSLDSQSISPDTGMLDLTADGTDEQEQADSAS